MAQTQNVDWLARYATNYHAWKPHTVNGSIKAYRRPLGLVESSFDNDGTHFGGRADMNALLTFEIRHKLSPSEFRERIILAWANLRLQHVILQSKAFDDPVTGERQFCVEVQDTLSGVVQLASESIIWIEDSYSTVDSNKLYNHCLNVTRIIDPSQSLSRLHVLPLIKLPNGNYQLRFLIIMAHCISDGLSAYTWFSHFTRILNTPLPSLKSSITTSLTASSILSRLPPAQEDLYPVITGSKARQRWFWALIRVLRHIRKPLPPSFTNPLWRKERLTTSPSLPPTFSRIFNYDRKTAPPMRCGHLNIALSKPASNRLLTLCRSQKLSIGSGCFALAGLAMMSLHEDRYPNPNQNAESELRYPAFTAGFPLNPRAFFNFNTPADSCMLAFSEGILMPFLDSSIPVEKRFIATAKVANRELRVFQKRGRKEGGGTLDSSLDAHSPIRLLATTYVSLLERVEAKLSDDKKMGVSPQGSLVGRVPMFGATCGVSSIGNTAGWLKSGEHRFEDVEDGEKDFVGDYRSARIGVRAREGEFLVGSSTDGEGVVRFMVSFDANAIPEEAAERWAGRIRGLLEEGRAKL